MIGNRIRQSADQLCCVPSKKRNLARAIRSEWPSFQCPVGNRELARKASTQYQLELMHSPDETFLLPRMARVSVRSAGRAVQRHSYRNWRLLVGQEGVCSLDTASDSVCPSSLVTSESPPSDPWPSQRAADCLHEIEIAPAGGLSWQDGPLMDSTHQPSE